VKQTGVILFILLMPVFACPAFAQSTGYFVKRGNNVAELTCSSITFAAATDLYFRANDSGAVWVKKPINLKDPFDISFYADFKDILTVDGAAFVLQPDSNNIGAADNGLGYKGINHSIAVTFDAIQNATDNDPPFDHIAIQSNGDIDHNSSNNLAGPVSLQPYYIVQINAPNPPGITFMHMIEVKWDAAGMNLTVLIDGNQVLAVQKDLVQRIFNGNPVVYWGFTGSNTQKDRYSPGADIDLGHFSFYTGDEIYPRFDTQPELDTCFGDPITFLDKSIYGFDNVFHGTVLSKWYWEFGDGTISTLRNPPPHVYPGGGIYNVKYTVTNQTGCAVDTVTRKITLGARPVIHFTYSPACVSTPVTFMDQSVATGSLVVDWIWNFDNIYQSDKENPVVTFTSTGTKTIQLKAGTNYNCTSDTSFSIEVLGRPAIDADFVQNCTGLVHYTALLTDTVQAVKWNWQFGDNTGSGNQNPVHQFNANGVYQTLLLAYSAAGCPSDSIRKIIAINQLHPFAGNDTSIAAGQPLQLQATGGSSYEWSPSTGLNNPLVKNPVAILNSSQAYVLTVRNAAGCEASDTINIKVYHEPGLYIPNAFTPNNDGKNDVFRITAPGIAVVNYFKIFNRWGVLLYSSTDISKGWNGTVNSRLQESGPYVWVIKAVDYNGKIIEKKGTVILIR
jgi:gliding motility-associated-like protein